MAPFPSALHLHLLLHLLRVYACICHFTLARHIMKQRNNMVCGLVCVCLSPLHCWWRWVAGLSFEYLGVSSLHVLHMWGCSSRLSFSV